MEAVAHCRGYLCLKAEGLTSEEWLGMVRQTKTEKTERTEPNRKEKIRDKTKVCEKHNETAKRGNDA